MNKNHICYAWIKHEFQWTWFTSLFHYTTLIDCDWLILDQDVKKISVCQLIMNSVQNLEVLVALHHWLCSWLEEKDFPWDVSCFHVAVSCLYVLFDACFGAKVVSLVVLVVGVVFYWHFFYSHHHNTTLVMGSFCHIFQD